jgi:hypothetical protein
MSTWRSIRTIIRGQIRDFHLKAMVSKKSSLKSYVPWTLVIINKRKQNDFCSKSYTIKLTIGGIDFLLYLCDKL